GPGWCHSGAGAGGTGAGAGGGGLMGTPPAPPRESGRNVLRKTAPRGPRRSTGGWRRTRRFDGWYLLRGSRRAGVHRDQRPGWRRECWVAAVDGRPLPGCCQTPIEARSAAEAVLARTPVAATATAVAAADARGTS